MKFIIVYFLGWIVPTILFFYLPVPANISFFQHSLTLYLFIGVYLILASSLSCWVMKKVLNMTLPSVYMNCAAVTAVFALAVWCSNAFGLPRIVSASFITAILLFCATVFGTVLSVAVKRLGELVPVCVTAAVADLTSVFMGPTKNMVEDLTAYYEHGMRGTPPIIDSVVIKVGVPGYNVPLPLFGVADWILLVLLSSALLRLEKTDNVLANQRGDANIVFLPVTILALFGALIFAQITHSFIPAMVFISTSFILFLFIKHGVHRQLRRGDLLYSIVFPVVAASMILFFTSSV
jgi:hypothetical protein